MDKTIGIIGLVENYIADNNLINSGDRILIGFSGGSDSTALLYVLSQLSKKLSFELKACYINHKIRPKAAKLEARFCSDFCKKYNIPFILAEGDVPQFSREMKLSLESAGREFRRAVLHDIAKAENCNKIALGHQQDDIIETILLRILRGTGPQGLRPIQPISGQFIRPLLEMPRNDLQNFLKNKKVGFMIDKSNLESKFRRNFIRNKIIPLIEHQYGVGYRTAILNFAKIIDEENAYLAKLAMREFKKSHAITGLLKKTHYAPAVRRGGSPAGIPSGRDSLRRFHRLFQQSLTAGRKIVVDLERISSYDLWLRRRVIKMALEKLTGYPGAGSFEEIERIDKMIAGALVSTSLSNGLKVFCEKNFLIFTPGKIQIDDREVNLRNFTLIPEINSKIKCRLGKPRSADYSIQKDGMKVSIDYDKLLLPLHVRGIKAGDKFTPLGLKGRKKVGDFLTDKKAPRYLRDEIPVILDGAGIVWVGGYQIAERIKIESNTRKVMQIEIMRDKRYGKAKI
jgi:tRNA(Ile)-lysidine synthase